MEWIDEGIVLSVRPHGETAAIAEMFTRGHGRHLGLIHGGRSRKLRPILQIGNHVEVGWKGRLPEDLGSMTVELRRSFAAEAMARASDLAALTSFSTLARLLPEHDPHPGLYEISLFVLSYIEEAEVWPALMVRWELALLDELGFGLDLSTCAATGTAENLIYVSPRSGRAVSADAGEPYKDRLLNLPAFLRGMTSGPVTQADIAAGFALTGHFLKTRVLEPRELMMPDARQRMVALVCASGA
jgi:DNA repair protein RecO (recombination protein O)